MGQIGGNDLWLFYALYTENIKLQISDTRLCGYMPEILKLVLFFRLSAAIDFRIPFESMCC